jgi:hypothetical protein
MELLNAVNLKYKIIFIYYILLVLRVPSRKMCLYYCNYFYVQNQITSEFICWLVQRNSATTVSPVFYSANLIFLLFCNVWLMFSIICSILHIPKFRFRLVYIYIFIDSYDRLIVSCFFKCCNNKSCVIF